MALDGVELLQRSQSPYRTERGGAAQPDAEPVGSNHFWEARPVAGALCSIKADVPCQQAAQIHLLPRHLKLIGAPCR